MTEQICSNCTYWHGRCRKLATVVGFLMTEGHEGGVSCPPNFGCNLFEPRCAGPFYPWEEPTDEDGQPVHCVGISFRQYMPFKIEPTWGCMYALAKWLNERWSERD